MIFFFFNSTGIDEASESEEESEEEKQNEEEAKEEEEEEEGKKTPAQAEKKKKKGQLATFTLGLVRLVWRACEERKKKNRLPNVRFHVSQTAAANQTARTTVTSREKRPPLYLWWLVCVRMNK